MHRQQALSQPHNRHECSLISLNPFISDIEQQVNQSIAAAAGVYTVKLDNFRLDSQFLMFYVRDSAIDTAYSLDRMQSDSTASILAGTPSVCALQAITSFRVLANGGTIVDTCSDIKNRAVWRKMYWPGSQVAEPIYFVPWAWLLRDHKNVTGFQNMVSCCCVM